MVNKITILQIKKYMYFIIIMSPSFCIAEKLPTGR
jgi:hypothetical protein